MNGLGGVVLNVGGIIKPAAVAKTIQSARAYICAMNRVGKPVRCVTLAAGQYSALYKVAIDGRTKADPEVVGMTIDGFPVVSSNA